MGEDDVAAHPSSSVMGWVRIYFWGVVNLWRELWDRMEWEDGDEDGGRLVELGYYGAPEVDEWKVMVFKMRTTWKMRKLLWKLRARKWWLGIRRRK